MILRWLFSRASVRDTGVLLAAGVAALIGAYLSQELTGVLTDRPSSGMATILALLP
ncbi:MAG: hypothetical protein AAFV62_01920 [Pseudomonadota bacterium]